MASTRIEFENGEHGSLKGQTEIETVLKRLWARMTVRFVPVAKICHTAINGRFWPKAEITRR